MHYQGFPPFDKWKIQAGDLKRWERTMRGLREEIFSDILQRIRLIIKNAASAHLDKTAAQAMEEMLFFRSMCESLISDQKINANLALKTQLTVCDYLMDFAVSGMSLSKSRLFKIHSLICGTPQDHAGSKAVCLAHLGKYKHLSNRTGRQAGEGIFGAPVERTAGEMLEYFRQLRGREFLAAHPVLQASYAHYALVAVHPFVNGNGRVARLLAFSFIYRSNLVPALSLTDDKAKYISALRASDKGDFRPFIDLVQEKSIESADLIKERIMSAMQNA